MHDFAFLQREHAKSRTPRTILWLEWCTYRIIAVSLVNARKSGGDDRARRDTTCHGCALLLSLLLSLADLTIMPRTVRYRASRRPAVWPPFCSISFRPTSSRLRMSCACFLPSTRYSLVSRRIYYARTYYEYTSVVSRRPVSDLKRFR